MKRTILIVVILTMVGSVFAQNEKAPLPTHKGTSFLGADIRAIGFSVGPNIGGIDVAREYSYGIFAANRLAIGGGIQHGHSTLSVDGEAVNRISHEVAISLFTRYYPMKTNGFFAELIVDAGFFTSNNSNTSRNWATRFDYSAGIATGYTIFLGSGKKWALEPKIILSLDSPFDSSAYNWLDFNSGPSLGFKYFFGGNKNKQ